MPNGAIVVEEDDPSGDSALTALNRNTAMMEKMVETMLRGHKKRGNDDTDFASSDDEEFQGLRGAKGAQAAAKLRHNLRQRPEKVWPKLEANLLESLGEEVVTEKSALTYLDKRVAIGQQRQAAYVAVIFCHIHGALVKGNVDRARMLALGGLMAIDQSLLDTNWHVAGKILGLEQPQWASWSGQDVAALQRANVRSRLLPPNWSAALAAELRDEETLMKARQSGKGGAKGGKGGRLIQKELRPQAAEKKPSGAGE